MDLGLTGTRAFVSGSTRGIGLAIARALLAEGVAVVVNGRDEETVRETVGRLEAEHPGSTVAGIAGDFGDPAQATRLVELLEDVDILVNNVGMFEVRAFEEVGDDDWQHYFDVNVMSAVRLSRRLLGPMLERGWGRVIVISSESGVNVPADMVHYGVTKAATLALANGLAKRTRGTGVTVNTILGGPTWSDGVAQAVEQVAHGMGTSVEDLRSHLVSTTPTSLVQRFLEPAEVADLAVYLASPRSSATNGAALRADGGVLTTTL
ncbi:SDR family oxidoreductase [Phycicoccus sp. M110.8]|uniref:SDR family NAD(P)-dependent oxidoreductase n=1 Tax=Phycicoccus sp. M110.8 TaxID=3075433 RepID=UPI0028FD900B|nr:SDR family NAD(P)-dependent oxidoreductase [Phycicoccus sp. M110.8]MDU0312841.1 SDR family oxidoreductase [Phycicoccus sp. M110.8]